jgi:hypothetical protein
MALVVPRTKAVALHLIEDDGHTLIEPLDGTETQAYFYKRLVSEVDKDCSSPNERHM